MARIEADKRSQAVKLERAINDAQNLEARIVELQGRLAGVEAVSEEEKRGHAEAIARLERRLVDMEGSLAAERAKVGGCVWVCGGG